MIHPLGLATKGTVWYLVAGTDDGQRTFRVDRMASVEPTGDRVVRPDGFDLAEAWRLITDELDEIRLPVRARGTATAEVARWLPMALGTQVRIGPADEQGRITVEIRGQNPAAIAGLVARFGAAIRLHEPPEVLEVLARIGADLAATYGPPPAPIA